MRPKHLHDHVCGITWHDLFDWGSRWGEDILNSAIDDLHGLVVSGAVSVSAHALPEPDELAIPCGLFSGKTDGHKLLCARAAWWISASGMDWTADPKKLWYQGGAADAVEREKRRKAAEILDGREMLETFVGRYANVAEFAEVARYINGFLMSTAAKDAA